MPTKNKKIESVKVEIIGTNIEPTWVIDMGPLQPPYTLRKNPHTLYEELKKYQQIYSILEIDPCLFLSIKYNGTDSLYLFDKKENQTFLLASNKMNIKGFYNDIDGGMPFWPVNVNQKQELISFYWASDMKETLDESYLSTQNIKNQDACKKLKELLKNLKEEDNPVVVIAKQKKQ